MTDKRINAYIKNIKKYKKQLNTKKKAQLFLISVDIYNKNGSLTNEYSN